MSERPKSSVALLVVLLFPLVLVALYAVGYFQLTRPFSGAYSGPPLTIRLYPHPVIARLYYPAAFVEAKIGRKGVVIGTWEDQYLSYTHRIDP